MAGWQAAGVLIGVLSMQGMVGHPSALRLFHVGHNQVILPMRDGRQGMVQTAAIESAALQATQGGEIRGITGSVWIGKPVWMCTVSRGRSVWHVMVDKTNLAVVAKIVVPQ